MKRPLLLGILTLLLLVIFAAAADGVQARLRNQAPAVERSAPKLPREWVWRRKVVTFDDMFRAR